MQENEHTISARDLRASIKKTQSDNTSLRLFKQLGSQLFESGWNKETAQILLTDLCQYLGAEDGVIAQKSSNTLTVLAAYGISLPMAARLPITGDLGPLLKPPCTFSVHKTVQAQWLKGLKTQLVIYQAPIAYKQQPRGFFAFTSHLTQLTNEQLAVCESVIGILGSQLFDQSLPNENSIDLSILNNLTPREREVFGLLPLGKSNAELAALLGISPGTVKIHVERVFAKLGLKDRTQAAIKAVELGFKSF
jgi:DNA-binding CsgD family transcriptional regulator